MVSFSHTTEQDFKEAVRVLKKARAFTVRKLVRAAQQSKSKLQQPEHQAQLDCTKVGGNRTRCPQTKSLTAMVNPPQTADCLALARRLLVSAGLYVPPFAYYTGKVRQQQEAAARSAGLSGAKCADPQAKAAVDALLLRSTVAKQLEAKLRRSLYG